MIVWSFLLGSVVSPLFLMVVVGWIVRRKLRGGTLEPPWIPTNEPVSLAWKVQTMEGKEIDLGEHFAGKVALVNFWATWCPPCVAEAESLDRLYERFRGRVVFACISRESPGILRRFQKRKGYHFPIYHQGSESPLEFRTQGIPGTFILSNTGRVVVRHVGAADWSHEAVVQLVEGLLDQGEKARLTDGRTWRPPQEKDSPDSGPPQVCDSTGNCS